MTTFQIRKTRPEDCETLVQLIHDLADYEKLSDQCFAQVELVKQDLFGDNPVIDSVIGWEINSKGEETPVAFALFFYNYSTFLTRKGLYLEDIFVKPTARRQGYGKQIMQYLAKLALEKNCGRFEWSVLDWNLPAIDFYEGMGAQLMHDWRICRLTGEALQRLADR